MSSTTEYAVQCLFWVVLMAGAGWAVSPVIDRIVNRGGRK